MTRYGWQFSRAARQEARAAETARRAAVAARRRARKAARKARLVAMTETPAQRQARKNPPGGWCTKHVYSGRRLVNLYGSIHRTPGGACDGAEHRRTAWWW